MFDTIYIEESIRHHPRTVAIVARFPKAMIIPCRRYTEIFNRKAQNFRLQKDNPAIILAEKFRNHVMPAPEAYNIGAKQNFYFSHMLNCIYDCRYCFLQGMYRSAHYVFFVNFESFESAIEDVIQENAGQDIHFFSGYDCDSLALEPVTHFVEYFLPVFARNPKALLEIRTKSTQIRSLLATEVLDNIVIAYSFTPEAIADALEHKTPTPQRRLEAMQKLQAQGWRIGLRFDPLIYQHDFREQYKQLFNNIFTQLDPDSIHSVSLGSFRLPRDFFRSMSRLYPDEPLFASPLVESKGMISYKQQFNNEMLEFCRDQILEYIPQEIFFPCEDIL